MSAFTQAIVVIAEKESFKLYSTLNVEPVKLICCSLTEEEVFDNIHLYDPALALIDCGVNTDGGMYLLGEIKALFPCLPVIFLTESHSEDTVISAFNAGARVYFRKPFNLFELQQTVESLVALRKESRNCRATLKPVYAASEVIPGALPSDLPETVIRAVKQIQKYLADPIYLDELASAACLSKFHFCRIFKLHIGLSPMKFVNLLRVRMAAKLLQRSSNTITDIAFKVGFSNLSEFSRQFKSVIGMSPSTYRRSLHSQ